MGANADFHPYDIQDQTVIFGGVPLSGVGGKGENFIKFSPESDGFTDEVAADGEVERSVVHDGRANVEIQCSASSPINDRLMAIYKVDKESPNGAGAGEFLWKDTHGRVMVASPQAWVMRLPDTEAGAKLGKRTWKIRLANHQDMTIIGGRG